ncbi:hypothetical protein FQN54_008499 [Arachnomyces sp. PD_36]|nr:hypothetical protein FQN54_008499 [Arachnomyces sp. PD_36]
MKTRSSAPPADSTDDSQPAMASQKATSQQDHKPTKMLILPSNATDEARILSLKNPRTGILGRYYFCPKLGLYEFTSIAYPKSTPSSTLFTYPADDATEGRSTSSISKDSGLLIATPIDVIFFALPILSPSATAKGNKNLLHALDDMLDAQDDIPKHLRYALLHEKFRPQVEKRMEAICDSVEASGEKMFRLNEEKLVKELVRKAERMVAHGLPPSMEERFIQRALETPLQSEQREDAATVMNKPTTGEASEEADSQTQSESQSSTATPSTSTSNESTSTSQTSLTSLPSDTNKNNNIPHLLRLRTALSILQSSYLPPHLSTLTNQALSSPKSPLNFLPLTTRLTEISNLRATALASRSLSDFSRKRGMDDFDEEGAESRAEKKMRLEEEEKRKKAGTSRGVRDLKKADTSGMKKLSSFFGAAVKKKKES